MVPMELVGVRVEMPANTPVVVLRETSGAQRLLPIVIGTPEASSIHSAIEGIESPRPLTHDLIVSLLERLGATLANVVVTEVRDHVFYAELHLTVGGQPQVVSSRPSDALAIAARTGSPIFASEALMDEVGQVPVPDADEEEEAIIDEFRDFLTDLDPDDFNS